MLSKNEKKNHYLLSEWKPENAAFWENKGKKIARRNLCISVACLLLAFCVWMLFSAVAVNLNKVGFNFTTDQLFLLSALPSLLDGIKYDHSGGSLHLAGNCRAKYRYPVLGIYHYCLTVRFCRCELCFEHGKYQFFLPQSQTG